MLSFKTFVGEEINQIIDPLAHLRITVFRDYPYLYDGDLAYEANYLSTYAKAKTAFVFSVFDGDKMVGACTCVALSEETEIIINTFEKAGIPPKTVCYFGESLLLQDYRGQGIGRRFFEEREAYAKTLPGISILTFCAVKRRPNHKLKPKTHKNLNGFWSKMGFFPQPSINCNFSWKEINEPIEKPKLMEFWLKQV